MASIASVSTLHLLMAALFGWLEREQRDMIEFLRAENRVLRAMAGGWSLRPRCGRSAEPIAGRSTAACRTVDLLATFSVGEHQRERLRVIIS